MSAYRTVENLKLPETVIGRIVVGMAFAVLLPVGAFCSYGLAFLAPLPETLVGWALRLVIESVFVALFLFSAMGLLWAFTGQKWAAELLAIGAVRVSLALFVFGLLAMPFAFWALWHA